MTQQASRLSSGIAAATMRGGALERSVWGERAPPSGQRPGRAAGHMVVADRYRVSHRFSSPHLHAAAHSRSRESRQGEGVRHGATVSAAMSSRDMPTHSAPHHDRHRPTSQGAGSGNLPRAGWTMAQLHDLSPFACHPGAVERAGCVAGGRLRRWRWSAPDCRPRSGHPGSPRRDPRGSPAGRRRRPVRPDRHGPRARRRRRSGR